MSNINVYRRNNGHWNTCVFCSVPLCLFLCYPSCPPFSYCRLILCRFCYIQIPVSPNIYQLGSCLKFLYNVVTDEKIALLGAIQSLFEGSMYTFVFLWTPALSPNDEEIPHGFIFATFMLASMLGSSFASRLLARSAKVESYMQIVFTISSASLMLPIVTSVCWFWYVMYLDFLFLCRRSSLPVFFQYICIHLTLPYYILTCQKVPGAGIQGKGWRYHICRMYSAPWFLCIRGLCGDLLAINHENEVTVHSWRGTKYNHELLPHTSEYLRMHCSVQRKLSLGFLFWLYWERGLCNL